MGGTTVEDDAEPFDSKLIAVRFPDACDAVSFSDFSFCFSAA